MPKLGHLDIYHQNQKTLTAQSSIWLGRKLMIVSLSASLFMRSSVAPGLVMRKHFPDAHQPREPYLRNFQQPPQIPEQLFKMHLVSFILPRATIGKCLAQKFEMNEMFESKSSKCIRYYFHHLDIICPLNTYFHHFQTDSISRNSIRLETVHSLFGTCSQIKLGGSFYLFIDRGNLEESYSHQGGLKFILTVLTSFISCCHMDQKSLNCSSASPSARYFSSIPLKQSSKVTFVMQLWTVDGLTENLVNHFGEVSIQLIKIGKLKLEWERGHTNINKLNH